MIAVREKAQMTQTDLAERLGKPQSFVSKYETGERRLDVVEFVNVCSALGIEPDRILGKMVKVQNENARSNRRS